MTTDGPCTGCRCSLLRRDNDRESLRVILPRICRLSRPADNCHSNKYPLWVSAIDENARSLRPDAWRVNPQKEVCRGMWRMFRKGSGFGFCGDFDGPLREQARSHILSCVHRTIVGASLLAKAVCEALKNQLAVANSRSAIDRCPRFLPWSYKEPAISSARIGSTDSSVSLRPWLAWQKPCM